MKKNDINNSEAENLELEEINASLKKGDHNLIAEITGFHPNYIGMILSDKRKNSWVLNVAKEIIKNREKLITKLSKHNAIF